MLDTISLPGTSAPISILTMEGP